MNNQEGCQQIANCGYDTYMECKQALMEGRNC
jgi:hypothetical protein